MLYVQAESFKQSVSIPDTATDSDVAMALSAASRAVEKATRRKRFDKAETPVTRLYTATNSCHLSLGGDDWADIDSVTVAGTTITDYIPEPLNAAADGRPYTSLWSETGVFASARRGDIAVTGLPGWPSVPEEVPQMVTILASRLLLRTRQAPFGIMTAGSIEGIAVNLARTDPEMQSLCAPLTRQLVGWR